MQCEGVMFTFTARVFVVLYNAGPLNVAMLKNNSRVVGILESFFPAQVNYYIHLRSNLASLNLYDLLCVVVVWRTSTCHGLDW